MIPVRVVIKVGSSTLTGESGGLDRAYIDSLVEQVCLLRDEGCSPVIVTSGAIAAGLEVLGLGYRPEDMPSLQAAAAVGQVRLVRAYSTAFSERGVASGQVLLTRRDTADREAYLHGRDTLERLIEMGAVPIVNENDTVAVEEIRFGDNDTLAALVATMMRADQVIILSDIAGLYDADPRVSEEARLLEQVEELTDDLVAAAGGAGSAVGSGGMATKVEAARVLMHAGIPLTVCDGRRPGVVLDAVHGHQCGTVFSPGDDTLNAKKLWIALGSKPKGRIVIDDGARCALIERKTSLLPAGVVGVSGDFGPGDAVVLTDESGRVIGRGLAEISSEDVARVSGMRTSQISETFPYLSGKEIVHRDRLAIL